MSEAPSRFRWCLDAKSLQMVQIGRAKARYVLHEDDGEGDLCGLGDEGTAVTFGMWEPIASLPSVLRHGEERDG